MTATKSNNFVVSCSGLKKGTPPDPCTVVIFGASGDLARRELVPSLYALYCQNLLPDPFTVIGFARTEWDDKTFRTEMYKAVQNTRTFRKDRWQQFATSLYYVQGEYGAQKSYATLRDKIQRAQQTNDWSIAKIARIVRFSVLMARVPKSRKLLSSVV